MDTQALHSKMLRWYSANKRDLPWRRNKDPYRIWISEIMLQQTRVETVIPYYERFLSNFPSVNDLATADTDTLLNLWAGLGYYSRARNLRAAAQKVMEEFGGGMPSAFDDLLSLPGIGPYTAAAISSIAHDEARAAIDGNLQRVFARWIALREDPKTSGKATIEAVGAKLVALGSAGDFNQAVMDLSAQICLPREPRCLSCPVAEECEARRLGVQNEIPLKKAKAPPIELRASGLIVIAQEELLLARRPPGEWLSGMWDLPWWIAESDEALPKELGEKFADVSQKRTITKHKITFHVRALSALAKPSEKILRKLPAPAAEFRWVKIEDLHGVNLPRPSERALNEALSKPKNRPLDRTSFRS